MGGQGTELIKNKQPKEKQGKDRSRKISVDNKLWRSVYQVVTREEIVIGDRECAK